MSSISDLYTQYHIFRGLQEHMLRVGAVAKMICDAGNIEKSEYIISACLLHDMGNIIKSELTKFPAFLEPEGLEYWTGVKQDFIEKYGDNDHHATILIAQEIGVSDTTIEYLDAIGLWKIPDENEKPVLEKIIGNYADMRVGPNGILSLDARLDDLKIRYGQSGYLDHGDFEHMRVFRHQLEDLVFQNINLRPNDINDTLCQPIIEELREYNVV